MVMPRLGFTRTDDPAFQREEVLEPVTNQVTTPPASGRHSATHPDTDIPLACGNPTRRDAIRRNRQAWHARGQGFESPKLHVFAAQSHIAILKNDLDFLHCIEFAVASSLGPRGSPRRSGHSSRSRTRSVPIRASSWEAKPAASRWSACPAENTSRASQLPGAPAPPLRQVTHAADIRIVNHTLPAEYLRGAC
jgi:hypothetical protein